MRHQKFATQWTLHEMLVTQPELSETMELDNLQIGCLPTRCSSSIGPITARTYYKTNKSPKYEFGWELIQEIPNDCKSDVDFFFNQHENTYDLNRQKYNQYRKGFIKAVWRSLSFTFTVWEIHILVTIFVY